jgi:hypothetical protein
MDYTVILSPKAVGDLEALVRYIALCIELKKTKNGLVLPDSGIHHKKI